MKTVVRWGRRYISDSHETREPRTRETNFSPTEVVALLPVETISMYADSAAKKEKRSRATVESECLQTERERKKEKIFYSRLSGLIKEFHSFSLKAKKKKV